MSEKVDPELGVHALEALVAANYCVGWNEAIETAAEILAPIDVTGAPPKAPLNTKRGIERCAYELGWDRALEVKAAAIRKLRKE